MSEDTTDRRTLIGVLASHDSGRNNNVLVQLFADLHQHYQDTIERFRFVFTGGTFDRILLGQAEREVEGVRRLEEPVRGFITRRATRLPSRIHGGVTILANLVVNGQCKILWPFLDPVTAHWLHPENLALLRLCDVHRVKRLINEGSVLGWFRSGQAEYDANVNQQPWPISLELIGGDSLPPKEVSGKNYHEIEPLDLAESSGPTIALIAHDEMKPQIRNFVRDYGAKLDTFQRILATSATGQVIKDVGPHLKEKVCPCLSGPEGGDIQIATEIFLRRCHVVIFFVDPLHAHPHHDDIRVVFAACMANKDVQMCSNEAHAREWMQRCEQ